MLTGSVSGHLNGVADIETAVKRELVLRLASLLWRLRRVIAIETDLFQIQAEIPRPPERGADSTRYASIKRRRS